MIALYEREGTRGYINRPSGCHAMSFEEVMPNAAIDGVYMAHSLEVAL